MKRIFYSVKFFALSFLLICIGESCHQNANGSAGSDSLAIRRSITPAPALSPGESIKKMHLEEGFEVKLVAAEPMVVAPVALSFDQSGRIWAVEMLDYMPDTVGTGEEQPIGKIVILSDKNGDGVMDDRKIFLDSLVLPRAICLIENGLLVAEPPKLWYYEIQNDHPVKKTLVDSAYAEGGNVEHQPNGLLRAVDNWIYNAKSAKRYRKKDGKWLVERTHFRGQWGLSQDDYGRLFYNNNSENLLGDYFTPGLGAYNPNQKSISGFNKKIVEDNRVYPVRPTPGVNRGYMKGVLDDSLRLVNFTAACGPLVYTANLFGKEYYGNAFVAEPSANLIKRNILTDEGNVVKGKQAYAQKEFLSSEDERFRPVNLYTGADGALYIVDLYRGIIQHKTYLTSYLKNEIKQRALTTPLSCGRIYKVFPKANAGEKITFDNDPQKLASLLRHANGWVRNEAQQLLIDGKLVQAIPALRDNLKKPDQPIPLIHSLWTLEGLGVLQKNDVLPLLKANEWPVRMQALSVLPSILNKNNQQEFLSVLQQMIDSDDTLAAPYIGFLLHYLQPINPSASNQLLRTLTKKYGSNAYVADAVISNLEGRETAYYKEALSFNPETSLVFNKRLKKVIDDIAKAKNSSNSSSLAKLYPKGAALFQSVCATCHGADGNGVTALAPPLNNSNWVMGDKNKLMPIVLYGLTGPVKVGEKLYKAPEINGDMPGIGQNDEISDEDIAQVLNFIRNSWNNKGDKITAKDISNTRKKYKGRENSFTMEELNKVK